MHYSLYRASFFVKVRAEKVKICVKTSRDVRTTLMG